jgi:prepilin-type N-terminal cleavage/methylation domain-containing protein
MKIEKGFTLIEIAIVIAIAAVISVALYMALLPAQKIGKANNAVRVQDSKAIERAIKAVLLDSDTLPTTIADIAEDTYYSLVASGASPSGTYTCDQLDADIARLDIASTIEPYIGTLPVDPEIISGDDSGYYLIRTGNLFDVGNCNWYTAPVVAEVAS